MRFNKKGEVQRIGLNRRYELERDTHEDVFFRINGYNCDYKDEGWRKKRKTQDLSTCGWDIGGRDQWLNRLGLNLD